ncbi:related to spindle pole body protein [Rhynchosporium secalis]|uniref:Related to spindle pole body protein n=1 Tax=Rhynchosporium secalis TaxID=38038 RepID=A0A1E1M6L5_RHYSE|nr:related to spindle pole body protein [Rhynchosporium secalis]
MSSREEVTLPATRPKSRKSLAHIPSSQYIDQENMTMDVGALGEKKAIPFERPAKKSRSKSIGPGGLDALKDTTGNRRKSLAAIPHPPPRSILKLTMPPLREIPAHISARRSPKKTTPPSAQKTEKLIDFHLETPGATISGADVLANPFEVAINPAVNETRVTLRTEEEQEAAARAREEKERKELEKEVISRRDARRKSLANRRVSFAPEATLHTWDVVVEYQDSTISSNSTNSTRRASSASGGNVGSPHHGSSGPSNSDPSEPPSTPPEQVEEETVTASPAHQRDLHQKKRRRSSGIPPMNFNNPDDDGFSSSPFSGSSAGDAEEIIEDDGNISNSDSSEDDGTLMSLDGGETTNISMASMVSGDSTGSSRLDEALREAARQAGTQGIDFDENGDAEDVEEDEEVVASFAPWPNKNPILESLQDQENINPFSPAFKAVFHEVTEQSDGEDITMDITRAVGRIIPEEKLENDEMSMDVTRAFGGIISNDAQKAPPSRRKSMPTNRRQSSRRRSSADESAMGDETMDLTMAIGDIQPAREEAKSPDDEDMTMEFTTVVGGVLPPPTADTRPRRRASMAANQKTQSKRNRQSLESAAEDETMDMTVAIGGIMSSIREATSEQDVTIGMDMTMALGGILAPQRSTGSRSQAKKIMEMESDFGSSPFRADVPLNSPPKIPAASHTVASETGSPSLTGFRGKGLRRSAESRQSTTPKSRHSTGGTPIKKPGTPSKQITPLPARAATPSKTPPSKNIIMRTSSPKKLFKEEIKAAAASTPQSAKGKTLATPNKLFQQDKFTGVATPNFLLTPQPRRSSGVGLDRTGLGSPKVAALLDRRGSIVDQARSFVPSQLGDAPSAVVHFENPRAMEEELDKERQEEEDRENGRKIMEREADQAGEERDVTLNLKEMIQSLTPKKKPLRGRKSLHVGAAKGILGKRPVELDDEEDDEDTGGVKRLKGLQGSPVKTVKLQAPPSKAETTTGRVTRASRKSMEESTSTPTTASLEKVTATTPRKQGRFKDAEFGVSLQEIGPPVEKTPVENPEVDEDGFGDDRIQLQDFLNMTSIRFMELTTTKRRHTIAPSSSMKPLEEEKDIALEDCVAAGAATIPMLELFQHACQELKRYISEGRKTVREIETETFEENPPLFREYISATPEMKVVMDNQLKNVKTHARLLSKGLWYDWRMTLLRTLKEGLFKSAEGMIEDEEILDHQQELLEAVLPELTRRAEQLQRDEADLRSAAEEIANCDQDELSDARQQLIAVDADVEAKKQLIADLRRQLEGKESEIEAGNERKQTYLEEIREAEKVRKECRGWTSSEISVLKDKVDAIEKKHGWSITGVSGTTTSMTYRKEIELVFDASSFQANSSVSPAKQPVSSRIDLWYIGANRERNPLPLTAEKDFFLQSIRDHVRGLPQNQTQVKDLLNAVSTSWNKASKVVDDIRLLTISCPTNISKTSDDSILIKSSLLIAPLTTKIEVNFQLTSTSGNIGIHVEMFPRASVVYGERFNEPKMGEFLLTRCGNVVEEKGYATKDSWGNAVAELGEKLLARGRK